MTIEFALALSVFFSVALARVSQRTVIVAGRVLGFAQILAAMVAAAVLPAYAVYMLQFHPAWTLGLSAKSGLVLQVQVNGLWLALGFAGLLVLFAAVTSMSSVFWLRSDHPGRVWWPGLPGLLLVAVPFVRGFDGVRALQGQWPPGSIAAFVVVIVLLVTVYLVHRADLGIEVQR